MGFEFQTQNSTYRISYKDILYFQSTGRKINIVMKKEIRTFYGKLNEIEKRIPENVFLRIHKSYLVNKNYVKEFTHKHFILRSNWVYGNGNNFVNRVLHAADTKDELLIASDQFGSPTSAKDLAKMIMYLISTNEYGTYHVTCRGVCSRYEFAQEILKLADKDIELRAVPTEQSDLSAVRPPYAVLDNFILRIIEVYDMPDWKESLKEYMDERTED